MALQPDKNITKKNFLQLKYITEKSEEITRTNAERKTKKKKKSEDENKDSLEPAEAGRGGNEN